MGVIKKIMPPTDTGPTITKDSTGNLKHKKKS